LYHDAPVIIVHRLHYPDTILEKSLHKMVWIVIAAGGLFRFVFLGTRQLTTEELMQAVAARANSVGELLDCLRGGIFLATPLDHLIQKCVVVILGESTWALRLHAALLGILAIWMFYRMADFLFQKRVAVYSTILFAFFPLAYHYSQAGQPYGLFLLGTLLSYSLLQRIVAGGGRDSLDWIKLALLLVFLLYSSYLGVTVLISQLVGLLLLMRRKSARNSQPEISQGEERPIHLLSVEPRQVLLYAGAAIIALLAFLPWAYSIWHKPSVAGVWEVLAIKLPVRIMKEFGDGSYVASVVLLMGLVAGIRALQRHRQQNLLLWLLTWGCLSALPVVAFELWAGLPFAIHDVLHCTPPLILISGYGLSYLGEQMTLLDRLPHRISSPAAAYAALLVLLSIGIASRHWRSEPVDWKGTAAYLQETARAGDAITMVKIHGLLEYYAPSLAGFRSYSLDPGPGSLSSSSVTRRIVVCLNDMPLDPSSAFQKSARKSPAWKMLQRRGFTIFMREK
jgi:hypothetical protein